MNRALRIAAAMGLGLAVVATSQIASAAPRGEKRYVTAFSRYGNPSLTAPIRPARFGYEVQLPGGVWIDCAGDCAETLRRQKVDFWETLQDEHSGDEIPQ